MEQILIDDLVENKWASPFDIHALEVLFSIKESNDWIDKFKRLCDAVKYPFSSPGNSFERKLINILNREYQLKKYVGPCSIRSKCESNVLFVATYDHLTKNLRNLASRIKFREINHSGFVMVSKEHVLSNFRSDVLNKSGIMATYNTFINAESKK